MSTEDDTPIVDPDQYVLGHSTHEIERLSAQARLYAPFTLSFFRAAGITEGMRVLEVGCGGGDVSLLIAQLVGANGEVVGVDQSATAIETAQQRAQELSAHNLRFLVADVTAPDTALTAEGAFDAVIGRSVLEFMPDPAAVLRAVTSYVRPGGVIAFQEVDWSGCRALPAVPTFDQCVSWGSAALQRSGADPYMGLKLYPAFLAAGLPAPDALRACRHWSGPRSPSLCAHCWTDAHLAAQHGDTRHRDRKRGRHRDARAASGR